MLLTVAGVNGFTFVIALVVPDSVFFVFTGLLVSLTMPVSNGVDTLSFIASSVTGSPRSSVSTWGSSSKGAPGVS